MSLTRQDCKNCANWGTGKCDSEDFRDRIYLNDIGKDCFVYGKSFLYESKGESCLVDSSVVELEAVFIFDKSDGVDELRVSADDIKQMNDWVLATVNDKVVGGVKKEYLKYFYLTQRT